jgi:hypothetical protein
MPIDGYSLLRRLLRSRNPASSVGANYADCQCLGVRGLPYRNHVVLGQSLWLAAQAQTARASSGLDARRMSRLTCGERLRYSFSMCDFT